MVAVVGSLNASQVALEIRLNSTPFFDVVSLVFLVEDGFMVRCSSRSHDFSLAWQRITMTVFYFYSFKKKFYVLKDLSC